MFLASFFTTNGIDFPVIIFNGIEFKEFLFPFGKIPFPNCRARFRCQIQKKVDIVERIQTQARHFTIHIQVSQVRPGKIPTRVAITIFIGR